MRASILLLALALALGGCGGARVVTVPVDAGSAHVAEGEILRIEFGSTNPSIGDSWYLVTPPDATVLGEGEEFFESECDQPGCGGLAGWSFPARGEGTTSLVFRYCYRSGPDDCQPEPDRGPTEPVQFTVTVG